MKRILEFATVATAFVIAATAQAATVNVKAELTSNAEVPPNKSSATGTLAGSFDPASGMLHYTITYKNLTGPAVAAHFHAPAPAGKNAGIEVPIKDPLASPIKGDITLNKEQAKNLMDGMTYLNIHTQQNKGGEIRGQVFAGK